MNKQTNYLLSLGFSEMEATTILRKALKMNKWGYSHKLEGEIVEHFSSFLDITDKKKRLGFILYWLLRSSLTDCWVRVPMQKAFYNDSKKTNGISYDLLVNNVVKPLLDLGYLECIPGNHGAEVETLVRPTAAFAFMLSSQDYVFVDDAIIHVSSFSPIIVRDANKKPISFSRKNRDYSSMVRNLSLINGVIQHSSITLKQGEEEGGGQLEGIYNTNNEETLMNTSETNSVFMSFTNSIKHQFYLYRIFNKRGGKGKEALFGKGGRFYASGQNMPKSERKNICINGEYTTELDFSNLHPRMLAAKEGIEFPANHDTYTGEKMLEMDPNRENHKEMVNALLSCSKPQQMKRVLYGKGYNKQTAEAYIQAVLEHNPWLSNHIGKDVGVLLQNVDAKMSEKIMVRFIKQTSSAILPIHDSYIVQEKYEDLLRKIMLEVWDEQYPDVSMEIG